MPGLPAQTRAVNFDEAYLVACLEGELANFGPQAAQRGGGPSGVVVGRDRARDDGSLENHAQNELQRSSQAAVHSDASPREIRLIH